MDFNIGYTSMQGIPNIISGLAAVGERTRSIPVLQGRPESREGLPWIAAVEDGEVLMRGRVRMIDGSGVVY